MKRQPASDDVEQRGKLYEGKAKIVYATSDPKLIIQYFKDDATAFNALKKGTIDALIAQYPYGIGQLGVQLAVKYLKGQRDGIKKHYGTGSAVVTRANVNSPSIKKYIYTP